MKLLNYLLSKRHIAEIDGYVKNKVIDKDEYGALWIKMKDVDLFKRIVSFKLSTTDYWAQHTNWSLKDVYPERWENQKKFILEEFISIINKNQDICDLASANGEWSFFVANYVNHIDGYEYAQNMVDTANNKAKELGVFNVSFYQADATKLEYNKEYDNFMMLGLLTYLSDEMCRVIVKNVYGAMKKGARLLIKDSVIFSTIDGDGYYFYNVPSNYQAYYRIKEYYFSLFTEAGFTLEKEVVLHELDKIGLKCGSVGAIFIK
jgi:2-polyprenyl-3-methyl-5-hydroxy-6-metoxy-1,4-benzoquinol methylase